MKWLKFLGDIDGAIMAFSAGFALYDPTHVKLAMLVSGIAGGLGVILNRIADVMGVPEPVPQAETLPVPKGGVN